MSRYYPRFQSFDFGDRLMEPSGLTDLKARLTHLLGGKDAYYAWSSRLPDRLVLDNSKYMAAIEAKIDELTASILADNEPLVENCA